MSWERAVLFFQWACEIPGIVLWLWWCGSHEELGKVTFPNVFGSQNVKGGGGIREQTKILRAVWSVVQKSYFSKLFIYRGGASNSQARSPKCGPWEKLCLIPSFTCLKNIFNSWGNHGQTQNTCTCLVWETNFLQISTLPSVCVQAY